MSKIVVLGPKEIRAKEPAKGGQNFIVTRHPKPGEFWPAGWTGIEKLSPGSALQVRFVGVF